MCPCAACVAVRTSVGGLKPKPVSRPDACCRREPRVVASQGLGPGVVLCGSGLVAHTPLLVALGRHPSGNVQVQVGGRGWWLLAV